jgi:hypothetical protein
MRNVYTIFVGRPEGKIFVVVYLKKLLEPQNIGYRPG